MTKSLKIKQFRTKQFEQRLNTKFPNQFTILKTYTKAKNKVTVKCNKCGYIWNVYPKTILQSKGCKQCQRKKHAQNRTTPMKEYFKQIYKKHPEDRKLLIPGNDYKNAKTPMTFTCAICHHKWKATPQNIKKGRGCPICRNKTRIDKSKLPLPIFKKRIMKRFGYQKYIFITKYNGLSQPITIKCKDCRHTRTLSNAALVCATDCPYCSHKIHKYTNNDFQRKIKEKYNNSIKVLTPIHDNTKDIVKVQCQNCGYIWKTRAQYLLKGHKCPNCRKNHRYTNQQFQKKMKKEHGNEYKILDPIKHNTKDYIRVKCLKCGRIWKAKAQNLITGTGCPYCAKKLRSQETRESPEIFKQKLHKFNPNYQLLTPYINTRHKVTIKCKKCGHTFTKLADFDKLPKQCIFCNASSREKEIFTYFDENKIHYYLGYTNPTLKYQDHGTLHLDFYIPKIRLAIEHQGQQHYKLVKGWGGKKRLNQQQARDNAKRKWCKQHHIKLIEIKYDEPLKPYLESIKKQYFAH